MKLHYDKHYKHIYCPVLLETSWSIIMVPFTQVLVFSRADIRLRGVQGSSSSFCECDLQSRSISNLLMHRANLYARGDYTNDRRNKRCVSGSIKTWQIREVEVLVSLSY